MAFTTPLTINGEQHNTAYIKAYIGRCDTQTTVVQLDVYTSQAARDNGALSVPDSFLTISTVPSFTTNLNLQTNNPVAYAYELLENSGKYPDATWNV
jgi:hypothetical protein